MAGLVSRLIIFSVSPFTCNAHRKHFNYDGLQKNCPDCQNILTDMTKFHDELREILREDETARLHFIYNFPLWISTREDSITSLKKVETELNKTKRDVNISNIVGSSAGIVGGVVAVVGLALAPLTAGVSLGLSIGGASLGTAGGLTAGGANVAELIVSKNKCKEIIETLEKDKTETDELFKYVKSLKRCDEKRERLVKEAEEFIDIVENGLYGVKSLVGPLGKAVEFLQNLANLEEVTFESVKKVFNKTFVNSPVNNTSERNTFSNHSKDLRVVSNLIVQVIGQGGRFSKLGLSGFNVTARTLPRAVPMVMETDITSWKQGRIDH